MVERIAVIDYGSGNLHSVAKAFERMAAENNSPVTVTVTSDPKLVETADRIVLPGQGAFGDCIEGLRARQGLIQALERAVIERGRPFLGICVGMQLLASVSYENGRHEGLNWIPGKVVKLENAPGLKIPHMGWNEVVRFGVTHPLAEMLQPGDHLYFVHSYHVVPNNQAHELAHTHYGQKITAMIGRDNIVGTQFHPEKSQKVGLKLITEFLKWTP